MVLEEDIKRWLCGLQLQHVWGTSGGDVYAVGEGGTILRGVRGATLAITPANPTISTLGGTSALTATARDAQNNVVSGVSGITWASSNTGVATVNAATGLVTAPPARSSA